jgi:hypothetical protein
MRSWRWVFEFFGEFVILFSARKQKGEAAVEGAQERHDE